MVTPKETGTLNPDRVYPLEVGYSALLENGCSSTGALADQVTLAVCFKPTVVDTTKTLCDPTNHSLLLIRKDGATVELLAHAVLHLSYPTTASTHAGLLSEAVTRAFGSDKGYYSNMYVVDGAAASFEHFYEQSGEIPDLWVCREKPDWGTPAIYSTGDRTADIAVTVADEVAATSAQSPSNLVDGDLTETSTGFWFSATTVADKHIRFQFGTPRAVTEARLHQSGANTHGTWKWQGSNNGTDWTDLSTEFTLGGATAAVLGDLSENTAEYTHYQIVGITGYLSATPWIYEFEFKESCSDRYGPHGGYYQFTNALDLGEDASGKGNDWTMTGSQSDDTPTQNGGGAAWELLDNPTVRDTSKYADILLRVGTGGNADITSLEFAPDLVNIKARNSALDWHLYDTKRGATKAINTNTTDAESTQPNGLTAFSSNGYTLGESTSENGSGNSMLDLALKASPEAGFEIVTYAGDGVTGRQLAHGLGKAPTFMVVKRLDTPSDWRVYHTATGNDHSLVLNSTDAAFATSVWNFATPTTTHIALGASDAINKAGGSYVAYLFTDSDVFTTFQYTGNGSADGPVVDLGGRPLSIAFLKNSSSVSGWINMDAARTPTNTVDTLLRPNTPDPEYTAAIVGMCFRANGFKVTNTHGDCNTAGETYVGLAVLRQPFKYSNAF